MSILANVATWLRENSRAWRVRLYVCHISTLLSLRLPFVIASQHVTSRAGDDAQLIG